MKDALNWRTVLSLLLTSVLLLPSLTWADETPAEGTQTEGTQTEGTQTEETQTKETPAKEAPAEETLPDVETPAWATAQIEEVQKRIDAWKGDDETVLIPLISDVHSGYAGFELPPNFQDTKWHVLFLHRAAVQLKVDMVADLGDIGFDRLPNWKESPLAHAEARLRSQVLLYKALPLPVCFCKGNHDGGAAYGNVYSEKRLTDQEYGEMFNGLTVQKGYDLKLSPNSDYGYFDVPNKHCRVFFLNNSSYGYDTEQLQFLADNMQKTPEGSCVLVLQHICVHPSLGLWGSLTHSGFLRNGDVCVAILEAFAHHAKGSRGGVQWDFTGNQTNTLAGSISGDSHYSAQASQFGVNYAITQCYGTVAVENQPNASSVTPVDRNQSLICDIVAIKPAKREMKIFRLGAGGAACDRDFQF